MTPQAGQEVPTAPSTCNQACQNWRANVVAVLNVGGRRVEYAGYGRPFGLPGGGTDSDGAFDNDDANSVDWSNGIVTYIVSYASKSKLSLILLEAA